MTSNLIDGLASAEVIDLAQPFETGMTSSPNHPGFRMALIRRHGDMTREDGSSAANELIVTGGHVGTHVDALAHCSYEDRLFGGVSASEAQRGGRFNTLGVDEIEPIVCRGVLLDVGAESEDQITPAGMPIGPEELERARRRADTDLRDGDAVLIRTGWARHFSDPERFLGHDSGVPGVNEAGAKWLLNHGVRITGSDTTAYEWIPPGFGHRLLPVHRLLLVERGIPIVEMLDLEALSISAPAEFCFILAPLKIIGATGSPGRPLAVL